MTIRSLSLGAALLLHAALVASAQPYPDKPIRMIVPFPPGSASDFLARTAGQRLGESFGQQIVIDNRPGAGGLVGSQILAKAVPDGYTVAMVGQPHITNVLLHKERVYDPLKDFVAVAEVASMPNVVVLGTGVPASNLKDLIALAKAKRGQLNYGSAGIGSSSHLAGSIFNTAAGIEAVHVPFKLIADIYTELLAGRIHYYVFPLPAAMPMVRDGKLRAIAVASPKRAFALPDVPTSAEAGLPDFLSDSWFGVVGPARLPKSVVARLNGEINKVVSNPDTRDRFQRGGADPLTGSPEKFAELMRSELPRLQKVVRDAGVTPQ